LKLALVWDQDQGLDMGLRFRVRVQVEVMMPGSGRVPGHIRQPSKINKSKVHGMRRYYGMGQGNPGEEATQEKRLPGRKGKLK